MIDKEKILNAVFDVVKQINYELPKNMQLESSEKTVLYGQSGKLDSLGLVNFIVNTEQKIQEEFGAAITIADERAMSMKNSPFRTLGSISDYIFELLKEKSNG